MDVFPGESGSANSRCTSCSTFSGKQHLGLVEWVFLQATCPSCSTVISLYTIQPCWTNSHCSFNRLSNQFDTRFDSLTTSCIHDTAGCQTGCQMGLTTGWVFVYTIQPVVKPVWQPVWQQVVLCKWGFRAPNGIQTSGLASFLSSSTTRHLMEGALLTLHRLCNASTISLSSFSSEVHVNIIALLFQGHGHAQV